MSTDYSWTKHDGVWKRKLGGMETFYLTLASPEGHPVHWMVGCCVSLLYHGKDSVDIQDALWQAWKDTRLKLPTLASTVDRANGEIVVSEDTSGVAMDEWLRKSFQSPHALIDGRGMLQLYHSLFTALGNPPTQNSTDTAFISPLNLALPYNKWLGLSPSPSKSNLTVAESIFRRILDQQQPIRLSGVDFDIQPQLATHTDLVLTEYETQSIIAACKQRDITLTSAWHAALAMAAKTIQSAAGEKGTSFAQFTTIDLRRWFPPHFRPREDSIGSLQTALPFAIDLDRDNTFEALSGTLHAHYKDPFAFADHDFNYLTPYMAASKQFLEAGGVPPSSTPSLSSMGKIGDFLADRYGDWELTDFWISSTMLTGDFQMYSWTFRGRLAFSVCYNEAFYDYSDVKAVLDETRHQILTGLGVVL
ncbi:hypothetical protein F4825DRAFT_477082 [Nemania diffusa]|nr:hypothetical protein F4825DRAFT_477082 [Nemania diffusa]